MENDKLIYYAKELTRGYQFVIVEFSKKHTLVFLVKDIENPQVPGYPARGIEYFDNIDIARAEIEKIYSFLNYWPKNLGYKSVWKSKRQANDIKRED